jgi:Ca2+-binding EF-hand superfamily protein
MRASLALLLGLLASGAAGAQQPDDYFARVDLDGNGLVSLPEFLQRMGFAFDQMDADGDDVLEPHEQHVPNARAITLAEHHERFTAQFRRQDTNRDGSLTRAELLAPPR